MISAAIWLNGMPLPPYPNAKYWLGLFLLTPIKGSPSLVEPNVPVQLNSALNSAAGNN
jgi:hypothetical protein